MILRLLFGSVFVLLIVCFLIKKQLGKYFKVIMPVFVLLNIISGVMLITELKEEKEKVIPVKTERGENSRKMDMIMWYDIDNGPTTNGRPERGWWFLNPQHPDTVKESGHYRTTTPLMGLYDQRKSTTARQHLYWISALGCNGVAVDLTNYTSYRKATGDWLKYTRGVIKNTENLLETATCTNDFDVPKTYITVRLFQQDYDALRDVLDDIYVLYEKYKSVWYMLDDGTENSDKPFVVIFADGDVLKKFAEEGISFTDQRFNIRWSNGYLDRIAKDDASGNRTVPENFWLFVESEPYESKGEGYYRYFCSLGRDGSVEQMIGWASVHRGGMKWDALNNIVAGKTTFERTIWNVGKMNPKALLVNRFNYAVAWKEEPQEGVSLYESTHIEPNEDFGFLVFDNVRKNLYALNSWETKAPPLPEVLQTDDNVIHISLKGYPTEYRISDNEDMQGAEWVYLNINDWIEVHEGMGENIYLQVRNGFGESGIVHS